MRHLLTVFAAGFTRLQALRISNQSTFLNNTPTPWTMCAYLISSVPCAGMCAKRWVWRGIQFLVLADQVIVHLYICCFEVVHIWLIRGRTRELDVGPSPKWPNVKTTFAAEREKKKGKTKQHRSQFHVSNRQFKKIWALKRYKSRLQVLNSQEQQTLWGQHFDALEG